MADNGARRERCRLDGWAVTKYHTVGREHNQTLFCMPAAPAVALQQLTMHHPHAEWMKDVLTLLGAQGHLRRRFIV